MYGNTNFGVLGSAWGWQSRNQRIAIEHSAGIEEDKKFSCGISRNDITFEGSIINNSCVWPKLCRCNIQRGSKYFQWSNYISSPYVLYTFLLHSQPDQQLQVNLVLTGNCSVQPAHVFNIWYSSKPVDIPEHGYTNFTLHEFCVMWKVSMYSADRQWRFEDRYPFWQIDILLVERISIYLLKDIYLPKIIDGPHCMYFMYV